MESASPSNSLHLAAKLSRRGDSWKKRRRTTIPITRRRTSAINVWFGRLILFAVVLNVSSIIYFHCHEKQQHQHQQHQQKQNQNQRQREGGLVSDSTEHSKDNSISKNDNNNTKDANHANHRKHGKHGKDNNDGISITQVNSKGDEGEECFAINDIIYSPKDDTQHESESSTSTLASPSGRIIPHIVHIILPPEIQNKSCIPIHNSNIDIEKMNEMVQKWVLPNHSLHVHDQISIELLVQKYRFSPTLSQFYSGLVQVSSFHDEDHHHRHRNFMNERASMERDTNEIHQYNRYPCSSSYAKRKSQNVNRFDSNGKQDYGETKNTASLNNEYDGDTFNLFQKDFVKFLVLWEYGGMVVSDLSYEPSALLLQALQEEQLQREFIQNQNRMEAQRKKGRRKKKDEIALFTTSSTELIIETNQKFEFNNVNFLASVPKHPLLHHLLTRTIQRYQRYLFNNNNNNNYESGTQPSSYHDEKQWNKEIYKFFTTRYYTHKFRKPTQISPPNVNRWSYLLEKNISTTITILDRDRYDGQSLIVKHGNRGDIIETQGDSGDHGPFLANSKNASEIVTSSRGTTARNSISSGTEKSSSSLSSLTCVNYFKPIQTNVTSLLEIIGEGEINTHDRMAQGRHDYEQHHQRQKSQTERHKCPEKLYYIQSKVDPLNEYAGANDNDEKSYNHHHSKIPNIIHITGKTKCLSKAFYDTIRKWYDLPNNYAVLYHDDTAIQRLFDSQEWNIFPQLKQAIKCINSGAGLADIWRYLLLWEYGGIYTDLDNAPGPLFVLNNTLKDGDGNASASTSTIISGEMDALFEVEIGRFPSQYFFAVSPHHPVMYFALQNAIDRLLDVNDVHLQKVPFVTGPGALKAAVIDTIGGDGYPEKGEHVGVEGRNITIIGSRKDAIKKQYIDRHCVHIDNDEDFSLMNMTRYGDIQKGENGRHLNCLGIIHEDYILHGQ